MVDTVYFLALTLIFIRITALFLTFNILFPKGTPYILKGALSLVISLSIINGIDYRVIAEINGTFPLWFALLSEVMTGIIIGFLVNCIFSFIKMAGAFIDMQAGLSMVSMMDPATNMNATLISNLLYMISIAIFFIVDGHHLLLRLLIDSFRIIPLGETIVYGETMMEIFKTVSELFLIGVKIALPFLIIIFITDLCLALVSRAVPAINVMILGMPVKITVALITFVVALPITIKIIINVINNIPNIFEDIFTLVSVAPIVFIASEEKTEEATPKKKSEARKKGQIARSKDIGLAAAMLVSTLLIITVGGMIASNLKNIVFYFLTEGMLLEVNSLSLKGITLNILIKIALCVLPIAIPMMVTGIVASLGQTGFSTNKEALKVKFSKLNPINGFKNMFSKRSAVDLVKNLTVVSIVIFIGYTYITDNYESLLQISNLKMDSIGSEVQNLIVGIFLQITLILIVLAGIDYFIQFKFHQKDLKMSKQEIKEEYKQMEGDPQIKGKIKQKQREMATKRMMSAVGDATVIITNPTHIAIAIKYDENSEQAPIVIGKGADNIALKIKEIAKENNIPIMENKSLARLIYETIDIDKEITVDLYEAVAEILAMVYKLKNK
ncbi:MAG: fused FliR family export protein/FlhB family type III secretion system protein [Clostridium sp.]|uniref:fused FliR family export protein/FlhB family type III secretion system protein n=1 Tax=Clostridium sp. TaxID=1506 RepID=UPI003F31C81B